jgi:hypothetical protein
MRAIQRTIGSQYLHIRAGTAGKNNGQPANATEKMEKATVRSGARPSPGAACPEEWTTPGLAGRAGSPDLAAPEDGRAPQKQLERIKNICPDFVCPFVVFMSKEKRSNNKTKENYEQRNAK